MFKKFKYFRNKTGKKKLINKFSGLSNVNLWLYSPIRAYSLPQIILLWLNSPGCGLWVQAISFLPRPLKIQTQCRVLWLCAYYLFFTTNPCWRPCGTPQGQCHKLSTFLRKIVMKCVSTLIAHLKSRSRISVIQAVRQWLQWQSK